MGHGAQVARLQRIIERGGQDLAIVFDRGHRRRLGLAQTRRRQAQDHPGVLKALGLLQRNLIEQHIAERDALVTTTFVAPVQRHQVRDGRQLRAPQLGRALHHRGQDEGALLPAQRVFAHDAIGVRHLVGHAQPVVHGTEHRQDHCQGGIGRVL